MTEFFRNKNPTSSAPKDSPTHSLCIVTDVFIFGILVNA